MKKTWAAICRFGGIGDNLIASSVLPALKKKYDGVEVITQRPQYVVFENNPFIDKLSVYDAGDIPGGGGLEWQKWFAIRAHEYDLFVNLSHTVEGRHAFFMAQTDFWAIPEYRRKVCAGSYIETTADKCGVPYADCAPGFFPTDEEWEFAGEKKTKNLGDRCVGWVISGSRLDKIYPFASSVIARIIREMDTPVILLGGPGKDYEIAKVIEDNVLIQNGSMDGLKIAIGEKDWSIRRVLTQAQRCDLVVGPDTGPMWAVASCGMPKIMLVSHASAENITKHWRNTTTLQADPERVPCFPCHRLHDVPETCVPNKWDTGVACISDITADRVFAAVRSAWHAKDADVIDFRGAAE